MKPLGAEFRPIIFLFDLAEAERSPGIKNFSHIP